MQRDGEAFLIRNFITDPEAARIQQRLISELAWEQETIKVFGKAVKVPRLTCWYGDRGAVYTYSGVTHRPISWTPTLKTLRVRVEVFAGSPFNSVLGNLYRNGQDSMGWHADKEKELGEQPCIASLSLGEKRVFKLRHNKSKECLKLDLTHGSLLVMGGNLQRCWRHCLPKVDAVRGTRVNLTFRYVMGTVNSF